MDIGVIVAFMGIVAGVSAVVGIGSPHEDE